ncbi:MAG: LysM peptidoglycan-binding domain-containing protein [Bacteroidia bacterium]
MKGGGSSSTVKPVTPPSPTVEAEPTVAQAKAQPVIEPAPSKIMPPDAGAKYHVVKYGDTLWQIANAYEGLTVEKLKSLNSLPDNRLAIGQKLRVQ